MANETWTIRRCLDWTRDYLKDRGDERPASIRRMAAVGCDRALAH